MQIVVIELDHLLSLRWTHDLFNEHCALQYATKNAAGNPTAFMGNMKRKETQRLANRSQRVKLITHPMVVHKLTCWTA